MLKEGDKIPAVNLAYRYHYNESMLITGNDPFGVWKTLNTWDIAQNKRIVIFGLPGVFTPTCGNAHAPQFEMEYPYIRKFGVDEVYCTAVNDPYVFDAYRKMSSIMLTQALPDGNGEFAKQMGMLSDMSKFNYGIRSWRYSMVVDNGIIEKMFVEPGYPDALDDPYTCSTAQHMSVYLKKAGKTSEYIHPKNHFDFKNERFFGSDVDEEQLLKDLKDETVALRAYRSEAQQVLKEELGEEQYNKLTAESIENHKKWGMKSPFDSITVTDEDTK